MNRLHQKYDKEVKDALIAEFKLGNKMEVPKISKVVVNTGIGDVIKNKEYGDQIKKDLSEITGQKAQVRPARKSVASFGIRVGQPVGLRVTLRGERMWAFLDKLFSIVLPRLRDFRGLPTSSFDGGGNYTIGIPEHTVFPEVDLIKSHPKGLEITIVIDGKKPEVKKRLLQLMGMPFTKE